MQNLPPRYSHPPPADTSKEASWCCGSDSTAWNWTTAVRTSPVAIFPSLNSHHQFAGAAQQEKIGALLSVTERFLRYVSESALGRTVVCAISPPRCNRPSAQPKPI
jgi:hypothetical protein